MLAKTGFRQAQPPAPRSPVVGHKCACLLLVVGVGTQARYFGWQSLEEPDFEDQEPSGASVSDGGAIGEAGGLSVWDVVPQIALTLGTGSGNGRHGSCDCESGVPHAQA